MTHAAAARLMVSARSRERVRYPHDPKYLYLRMANKTGEPALGFYKRKDKNLFSFHVDVGTCL